MADQIEGRTTLPVHDKAALLREARAAAGGDPAASVWIDRVLVGYLDRGVGIPVSTARMEWLGTDEALEAVAMAVAMLAEETLSPARILFRSVPDTMDRLALHTEMTRRAREKEWRKTDIGKDVRAAPVSRAWRMPWRGCLVADVSIGPMELKVEFGSGIGPSGARTDWTRNWTPSRDFQIRMGSARGGTGTFGSIDRALKFVTNEFLRMVAGGNLEILGADAKRNQHNSTTYSDGLEDGWVVENIVDPTNSRAGANGVTGIRIVSTVPGARPRNDEEIGRLIELIRQEDVLCSFDELELREPEPVQEELFEPTF
jgi:hypothetical protein